VVLNRPAPGVSVVSSPEGTQTRRTHGGAGRVNAGRL
jgi:hypothetical protein